MRSHYLNPKMRIIWAVLESAKDVDHEPTVAACRRLLDAYRKGWRDHNNKDDWELVLEVWEELRDSDP